MYCWFMLRVIRLSRKPSNERRRLVFGKKLTLEDIEAGIERGVMYRGGDN